MSYRILLTVLTLVALVSGAMADDKATIGIPPTVTYQGILTTALGTPYPDGTYSLTLRLYDALSGGNLHWQEVIPVLVTDGVFSTELGLSNPLDTLDYKQHFWLTTQVNSDSELYPRIPLTSTPYAFIAGSVDDGAAVRSLNGIKDEVSLVAGSGMTVTPSGQSIILSSSGGTGGGADSDWAVNGNDMFSLPTGNVGIGTAAPAKKLHVVGSGINGTQIYLEDITDPAAQSFQLVNFRFKTALNAGWIEVGSTTSGLKYMTIDGGQGRVSLNSGDLLNLRHENLLQVFRGNAYVADFNSQDEFRMFSDSSGEEVGLMLRGQDPAGENNGGEIHLFNESGNVTMRLDGFHDNNRGPTMEMNGPTGLPGVSIHGQRNPGSTGGLIRMFNSEGNQTVRVVGDNSGTGGSRGGQMLMYSDNGNETVRLSAQEDGSATQGGVLKLYNEFGQLTVELDADYGSSNEGRVITDVLEITGGSDLSEQFDVSGLEALLAPGHVVSIDPDHPGELKLSDRAYDTCVAGVISGAGGVRPGMVMGQRGSEADGEYPVALTGRVYVQVDASNGQVKPGDLLTTSDVPGHAMKVSDSQKSQGAVLGKAMTSLESGQGLVLVLVSLQ